VVEPRLLFHRDGQWYLAAWNVAKGAEHLVRLDRIVSVEPGLRVFGEHKGPPVARHAGRSLYFESGAEREVTLRFSGAAARLARKRYGARARANANGTVSATAKVTRGTTSSASCSGTAARPRSRRRRTSSPSSGSASRSCGGCTRRPSRTEA
jgi:proteasome accessory factor C